MANQLQRLKRGAKRAKRKAEQRLRKGTEETKERTRKRLQQARAQAVASARDIKHEQIKAVKEPPEKSPAERANEEAKMAPPIDATLHPTSSIETMDQFAAAGGGQQETDIGAQQDDVEPMENLASIGFGGDDNSDEEFDELAALGLRSGDQEDSGEDELAMLGLGMGPKESDTDEEFDELADLGLDFSGSEEDEWRLI